MIQDLLLLSADDFWHKLNNLYPAKGGVHKIVAVQNGKRIGIGRFLGIDCEGILYIGKAKSFTDRVPNLKKSIDPDYGGSTHNCGKRYKANPNIAQQFPYEIWYIELFHSDNPEELEKKLLSEYRTTFGEVPPLNAT